MTKSLSQVLARKYILVLGLILVASLVAFFVFQELLRTQIGADIVNQSGRQRMLVTRIALDAELLSRDNREERRARMAESIDQLAEVHAYVQKGLNKSVLFGLWGWWSIDAEAEAHSSRLDRAVRGYMADAQEVLAAYRDGNMDLARRLSNVLMEQATVSLMFDIETSMQHFERVAEQRLRWLQIFAIVGESLTIMLLLFSGVKVFRPLVNEVGTKIKQLEHIENYHRSMMNNVGDGVVTFDDELVIRYANSTFEAMTKRSADQLVGRSMADVLPEVAAIEGLFGSRTRRLELVHNTGEGGVLIFDVSLYIFEFAGNLQCIASLRDITDRKALEDRLRTFYFAIEHSPLSIVITNTSGVIEYANRRCAEVSGFELGEIIGATPRLFKSGQTPVEVYRDLWDALLQGREWFGEMLNKRKNGDLYWEFEAVSAMKNEKGETTHFIAIKEDITEQKKSAAALVDAKRQAEIANRAKSEFLANMSHELRTPLNAIIGFAEVMTMELFGSHANPKYQEYSHAIQDSAKHLLGIINDILDFSKLEAGRVNLYEETVRVADLMAPVLIIAKERADARGIKLLAGETGDDFGALPYLHVDALRYKQVLLNIISNAVKFTQPGGSVSISAKLLEDGSLDIVVADTGIGMKPADIPKALERFGQVDSALHRKYEGTGLGLPISKTLIELHGGTLKLTSVVGKGTTATVHLPASRVIFDPASMPTPDKKTRDSELV